MGSENSRPVPQEPFVHTVQYNNPRGIYSTEKNGVMDEEKYRMYDYDSTWVNRKPGEVKALPATNTNGSTLNVAPVNGGDGVESNDGKDSRLTRFADDYANNTSFHGINWTRNADTIVGRLIWLAIVLGMASFLIYQINERVTYYLSWPVTVDIQIKIGEQLTFPAVTICNTNTFKLSEAHRLDLFHNISLFFATSEQHEKLEFQNDSRRIFDVLKHDKEDFIKECMWMQKECGPEDFQLVWTDSGICYTFNGYVNASEHELNNYRTSPLTGPKYGLQLTLNIETYDSMAGPSSSAGIKVLPHNQNDPPLIEDFAISVPPKMGAFIGLKLEKITNLKSPYGNCIDEPEYVYGQEEPIQYSQFRAERNCFAEMAKNVCSCVTAYMPPNGSRYCNLDEVKCVQQQIINDRTGENKCRRFPACAFDAHHSSVAYSAISDFSAIRISNDYNGDSKMIEQYKNATVLRHRVMTSLFKSAKHYMNRSAFFLGEVNTLLTGEKGIAAEIAKWNQFMLINVTETCLAALKSIANSTESVRQDFAYTYNITETATYLQNYQFYVSYGLNIMREETKYLQNKGGMRQLPRKDIYTAMCLYWSQTLEDGNLATAFRLPKIVADFQSAWDKNKAISNPTYGELVWRKHAEVYGRQIVDTLTGAAASLERTSKIMNVNICPRIEVNFTGKVPSNKELQQHFRDGMIEMGKLSTGVDATMKIAGQSDQDLKFFNSDIVTVLGYVEQYKHTVGIRLNATKNSMEALTEDFVKYLLPKMNYFDAQFRNPENPPSKLEVLKVIEEAVPNVSNFQDKFSSLYKNLEADAGQLKQQIRIMHDVVHAGISNIEDRRGLQPTLNDTKRTMDATVALESNLDALITEFGRKSEEFTDNCRELLIGLKDFKQEIGLTPAFIKDNFVQIQVYYQTLSFTKVERKIAYGESALLCDSGGTAGLYIGASFISIIELCYFVAKHCFQAAYEAYNEEEEYAEEGRTNEGFMDQQRL